MNKSFAATTRLSALLLALVTAGCGGGSTASTSPLASAPATRDVQGNAAKGTIKGGLVQIFALDASGKQGAAPIATATTDAAGHFKASVPADVLQFVIQVGAAPGATMADEATGIDLPVPANMVMRTVATLAQDAAAYTGSVTPLTELAVKTAEKASGGLTAANIAAAKAGARAAFGFDPETVAPVNANSAQAADASADQKNQALLLAAISKLAKDGALGCAAGDVKCVVDKFADTATVSAAGVSLGETGTKLAAAVQQVVSDPHINHTGKATIELPPGLSHVVVLPPAAAGAVAEAKKLFASLRANVGVIRDGRSALEQRAALVKADFARMVAPVDEELQHLVFVPGFAVDYFADFKAGRVTAPETVAPGSHAACSIYSDAARTTLATSAASALNIACIGNRKTVYQDTAADGTATRKEVIQVMIITPTDGATHPYAAFTRLDTYVNGVHQSDQRIGNYGSGNIQATGVITYTAKSSTGNFAVSGMMPARTDDSGNKVSDYEQWDLAASRQTDVAADTATFTLKGAMSSYLDSAQVGKLSVDGAATLGLHDALAGAKSFDLNVTGESGASAITGILHLADWKLDKSKTTNAPTVVQFNGSLTQGGAPFFGGALRYTNTGFDQFDATQALSAANFMAETLSLGGELAIPQGPSLKLYLTVTESAIGNDALEAQYDDRTSIVNLKASQVVTAAGTTRSASFSSGSGVALAFTSADLVKPDPSVPVLLNSAEVARVNLKTGVITYSDGSVESVL